MGRPGWMIAKWQKERVENQKPFKKMKDRDMTDVEVIFDANPYGYYFNAIKKPLLHKVNITMNYIANLAGKRGISKYYSYHGYGGWVSYLSLNESEFQIMKSEVERLGGKVIVQGLV